MKQLQILTGAVLLLSACAGGQEYVQNPDPNHTHADFAMYVRGEQVDFARDAFMSGAPGDAESHDDHEHEHEHKHDYLHLHNGVGYVLHRHKPGLSIGEFFGSLGFTMSNTCVRLSSGEQYCNGEGGQWRMFVRNPGAQEEWQEMRFNPKYVFQDMDQILLTYWGGQSDIAQQKQQMTDAACKYSKTCPWRGEPPAEDCVADPAVPCVAPELE